MGDQKDNTNTDQQIMDQLVGLVENFKTNKKRGPLSIFVVVIVAFIAGSYFYFMSWKKGREYAKLKHERDVAEQAKAVKQAEAQISTIQEQRDKAEQAANQAQAKITDLNAELERVQLEHAEATQKLNQVTSWDDIDRLLGRK